ncbi:PREDICTED: uncharacterized protein LOC109289304 [Gavialis gangeticus]|uniref:uncharacterized protein LOC109289304 n=1 Tax=Gavialis gangeticus TaxID=94835 RepID=UPI00092F7F28|nr:PREDICTED: uncharacterized protein LOC109289304 [Gavialis gangeticus]
MGIELTLAQEKEAWEFLIELKEVFSENPGRADASSTAIGAVLTQRDADLDRPVSRKLLLAKIKCGEDKGPDRDGSLHRLVQQVTGTAEGGLEKPPQGSWQEGLCPRARGMKEDLPVTRESVCEGQKAEPTQLVSCLFIKLWPAGDVSTERRPAWIKMVAHAAKPAGKERTQPQRSPQPRQAEAQNQKSRSGQDASQREEEDHPDDTVEKAVGGRLDCLVRSAGGTSEEIRPGREGLRGAQEELQQERASPLDQEMP